MRLLLLLLFGDAYSKSLNGVDKEPDEESIEKCLSSDKCDSAENEKRCEVYLAKSTLYDGEWGVFSGVDIEENNKLGATDVVIPWFQGLTPDNDSIASASDYFAWQNNYLKNEEDFNSFVQGTLAFIQWGEKCLHNVKGDFKNALVDQGSLNRSLDPGIGAFTPYHNLQVTTTKNISAGMELFSSYDYFTDEDRRGLVGDFFQLMEDNLDIGLDKFSIFWDFLSRYYDEDSIPLPKFEEIEGEFGGETNEKSCENHVWQYPLEWLEENGICIDNLKPGPSTIPQAGRGAFSTRFVSKGSIVTSSPLFFLCEKDDFLYKVKGREQKQLMINYGFSHWNSSAMFYPYGPHVSLINHNDKPNVKIQWAESTLENDDFLYREFCQTDDDAAPDTVIWDYVALRDIQPNEEIFIHYGDEWSKAWKEHVQNFKPILETYEPASFWNHLDQLIGLIPPKNIITECFCFFHNKKWKTSKNNYWETCNIISSTIVNETIFYEVHLISEEIEISITDLPRKAIRFSDRPYTLDFYLKEAFRHEIHMPRDIFAEARMN